MGHTTIETNLSTKNGCNLHPLAHWDQHMRYGSLSIREFTFDYIGCFNKCIAKKTASMEAKFSKTILHLIKGWQVVVEPKQNNSTAFTDESRKTIWRQVNASFGLICPGEWSISEVKLTFKIMNIVLYPCWSVTFVHNLCGIWNSSR
jgi:hypothetical protein